MSSNFTQTNAPIVDKDGRLTPPWRIIFTKLWRLATGDSMSAQQTLFPPFLVPSTVKVAYPTNATTNSVTRIDKLTVMNPTGGSSHLLSVYLVPPGGVANASTQIISSLSVSAGTTTDLTAVMGHVLGPQWTLQVSCPDNNQLTLFGSGTLIQ